VPLEMGATLSRAFLSAGARRVIASLWPVSDNATTELMKRFFVEISGSLQRGESPDYAVALQRARNHVRQCENGRWSEPYFWAPFVLLGPAN
jgi:CHAT domain-containing protein